MATSLKEKLYPIKGYEGLYAIAKNGRVWSYPKRCSSKKGKFLKQGINARGYSQVVLYKEGDHKNLTIHRLLASTFIPNTDNKPEVNHIDGIKIHNELYNLEWVTKSENQKHASDTGLHETIKGECHVKSKLSDKKIVMIKKMLIHKCGNRQIARIFKVSHSLIGLIGAGKRWAHVKEVA